MCSEITLLKLFPRLPCANELKITEANRSTWIYNIYINQIAYNTMQIVHATDFEPTKDNPYLARDTLPMRYGVSFVRKSTAFIMQLCCIYHHVPCSVALLGLPSMRICRSAIMGSPVSLPTSSGRCIEAKFSSLRFLGKYRGMRDTYTLWKNIYIKSVYVHTYNGTFLYISISFAHTNAKNTNSINSIIP